MLNPGSPGRGQSRLSVSNDPGFPGWATPKSWRKVAAMPTAGFSWSNVVPVTMVMPTEPRCTSDPPTRYTLRSSRNDEGSPGWTCGSQRRFAYCGRDAT